MKHPTYTTSGINGRLKRNGSTVKTERVADCATIALDFTALCAENRRLRDLLVSGLNALIAVEADQQHPTIKGKMGEMRAAIEECCP